METKFQNHTFPAPEQLEHLSVLGADKGWFPLLTVATGSIRTSDPLLEQRAQARYPENQDISSISTKSIHFA